MARIPKEVLYAGTAVICVIAAGWFYTSDMRKTADIYEMAADTYPAATVAAAANTNDAAPSVKRIKVYIAGAVVNPGVYELDEGSRVEDALNLAGGPAEEADMLRVNLAARLKDEQQIIVPKEGETVDKLLEEGQNKDGETRMNINTADESELMELPGVGQVTAKNIISYRMEHGDFKSIEDIKNVVRIGEKTFERLKDLIIVD
ncbi:MAG: helix-hairpin-helix domain-containing protein [Clostridiales bacterium]|jgi:competence protein ComEA|nr:helix-hairpin-helix domain-containing protein [Clostridiales bacterium]